MEPPSSLCCLAARPESPAAGVQVIASIPEDAVCATAISISLSRITGDHTTVLLKNNLTTRDHTLTGFVDDLVFEPGVQVGSLSASCSFRFPGDLFCMVIPVFR